MKLRGSVFDVEVYLFRSLVDVFLFFEIFGYRVLVEILLCMTHG